MEKKLGKVFYRVCKLYNSFCSFISPHDRYIHRLEDEILTNFKKEEDYPSKNHEEILRLIESYPLEVLQNLSKSEVDALATKLSELLRASLLTYPMSEEFEQETTLIRKRIAKPQYPLATRLQSRIMSHFKDLDYRVLHVDKEVGAKIYLAYIYKDVEDCII